MQHNPHTDSILPHNTSPGIYSLKQQIKTGGRHHTSAQDRIAEKPFFLYTEERSISLWLYEKEAEKQKTLDIRRYIADGTVMAQKSIFFPY